MRSSTALLIGFLLFALPSSLSAVDIPKELAMLKAVGPEGAGTAAARAAWSRLSQGDAASLTALLGALDDAGPLAANWIRAAIDTIAERELQHVGKLPVAPLEKFTLDTSHAPRARRLAFEWLCRADAKAADRLIPGMLNDPGVEFRRDAVARLLTEAEGLEAASKGPAAADVYRRAMSGARDLDQVQKIVKKLESFGDKVDVPAHFGYVLRWKLMGPFDNTDEQGFDVIYPPEQKVDFAAECEGKSGAVKWIDHATEDPYGKVDLNKALLKANSVVGYAACEFVADEARPVELRLTSMCANKLWLNGELLAQHKVYHAGARMDQYIARANLNAGRNLILLKICQNNMKEEWAQDWDFQFRVCDKTGTAVLSRDRVARATEEASAR
ncbi:MAG: hypothetical protein HYX69_03415 [Planctomycetia bacterium]|nr:hypothetical protein [Planctomycetia bacterium]